MTQIGNVPEINSVKKQLEHLAEDGLVKEWEVPYENILTRLNAAIFFISPADGVEPDRVWASLAAGRQLKCRLNEEQTLSRLKWRVEFE